jgi:hypothetical protein
MATDFLDIRSAQEFLSDPPTAPADATGTRVDIPAKPKDRVAEDVNLTEGQRKMFGSLAREFGFAPDSLASVSDPMKLGALDPSTGTMKLRGESRSREVSPEGVAAEEIMHDLQTQAQSKIGADSLRSIIQTEAEREGVSGQAVQDLVSNAELLSTLGRRGTSYEERPGERFSSQFRQSIQRVASGEEGQSPEERFRDRVARRLLEDVGGRLPQNVQRDQLGDTPNVRSFIEDLARQE